MLIRNKTDLNKVICKEDAINKLKSINIPVMKLVQIILLM